MKIYWNDEPPDHYPYMALTLVGVLIGVVFIAMVVVWFLMTNN